MEIEIFNNKQMGKGQITALAIDKVKHALVEHDALDVLIFAKRLKLFAEQFTKEAEENGFRVWDIEKSNYKNINYTQGGKILNYREDPTYQELEDALKERRELLNTAFTQKEAIYDSDGTEVPKVSIKGYRKDSLNVKL